MKDIIKTSTEVDTKLKAQVHKFNVAETAQVYSKQPSDTIRWALHISKNSLVSANSVHNRFVYHDDIVSERVSSWLF